MKCRKCGAEIADNSIRCENCGIKVNMVCPECGKLVPFGEKKCIHCDFELIKICKNCNSSNLFSATECRKCGTSFVVKELEPIIIEDTIEETTEVDVDVNQESEIVGSFSSTSVSCPDLKNATIIPNIEPSIKNDTTVSSEVVEQQPKKEISSIEKAVKEIALDDVVNDEVVETEEKVEKIETIDEQVELEQEYVEDEVQPVDDIEYEEIDNKQDDFEEEPLLDENIEIEPIEEIENVRNDFEINQENQIQEDAVNNIVHLVKTSIAKHVIAINGPEGSGKTAVLKQVERNLVDDGYLFLFGSCTPLLQITSFGFFQDAFLRLMGFPPFTKSIEAFVKGFKESDFASHFSFLSPQEINSFLNIFYPSEEDKFENILNNKEKMFELLEKVIKSFSLNQNLVLAIDNFDLLDGASYDFIVYLLNKGYFTNRLKLVVTYQEDKAIQTYFNTVNCEEEIFEMVTLQPLSDEEIFKAVKASLNIDIQEILPEDYLKSLLKKTHVIRF